MLIQFLEWLRKKLCTHGDFGDAKITVKNYDPIAMCLEVVDDKEAIEKYNKFYACMHSGIAFCPICGKLFDHREQDKAAFLKWYEGYCLGKKRVQMQEETERMLKDS